MKQFSNMFRIPLGGAAKGLIFKGIVRLLGWSSLEDMCAEVFLRISEVSSRLLITGVDNSF